MLRELISYTLVKKEIPLDYFRKFLYRNEITNCNQYLSMGQYRAITNSPSMEFPEVSSILRNKLLFGIYCEKHGLAVPRIISYHLKNQFFFKGEPVTIGTKKELYRFFSEVMEQSGRPQLFLKYLEKYGGEGALRLTKNNLQKEIDDYDQALLSHSYIHQEILPQHPAINTIYSGAVNTIRMDTYKDLKGRVHILSALMRFGVGNSITDNASGGGFYVGINHSTGTLRNTGRYDMAKGGGSCTRHPDTNKLLEGYQIPFYTEACELAVKAVRYLPNRIIGWDIAIGENGSYIIEGNEKTSLHLTDVAYGGYCKHPLIQEILNELKL